MLPTKIVIHADQRSLNLAEHGFGHGDMGTSLGVRIFVIAMDDALMGCYRHSNTGVTFAAVRHPRRAAVGKRMQ